MGDAVVFVGLMLLAVFLSGTFLLGLIWRQRRFEAEREIDQEHLVRLQELQRELKSA